MGSLRALFKTTLPTDEFFFYSSRVKPTNPLNKSGIIEVCARRAPLRRRFGTNLCGPARSTTTTTTTTATAFPRQLRHIITGAVARSKPASANIPLRPITRRTWTWRGSRRFNSNSSRRGAPTGEGESSSSSSSSSEEVPSLSARLRKLTREYGWVALGVYLGLSALDLPVAFVIVRSVGAERIGQWEHAVIEFVKRIAAPVWPIRANAPQGAQEEATDQTATIGERKKIMEEEEGGASKSMSY